MGKERELKWHEELFSGVISATFGFAFLFNGFSYLTSLFIDDVLKNGKPTGQKALIALASMLEQGWLKYLIVFIFLLVAGLQIKNGIRKYRLNNCKKN